jgi:hypothetical protein
VVAHDHVRAVLRRALEKLAVGRHSGGDPLHGLAPGDLEPVRPVVVERLGIEQVVEERDQLVAGGHPHNVNLRPGMSERDEFLESLMDTSLFSMGAYFSDRHPDLVDEVIGQAVEIEERGLRGYARDNELSVEECFETLLTGLAVRYYKAVAS